MRKKALLFYTLLSLFSCNFFQEKSSLFLVEVYGKELYYNDIQHLMTPGLSHEDSTSLLNNICEKWIKEQLLVQKAKINLPLLEQNVNAQVERYQNSLLIYAYQKELLNQKLDTIVEQQEIETFYQKNKINFPLIEDVASVNYIKLKKEVPYLWKLKSLYKKNDEESTISLEDYCFQFAQDYYIDDDWQYVKDIISSIPLAENKKSVNIFEGKSIELSDDEYYYFIYIKKYKQKGNVSPLEMVENQIQSIIINQRKVEFLKQVEIDLYQKALSQNYIKYEKE